MMTTNRTRPTNTARPGQVGARANGKRRTAGIIAATALGLALLTSALPGQGRQVAAASPHTGQDSPVAERPTDASTGAEYRWDFEHYPSR
jgi:hypothetical protein